MDRTIIREQGLPIALTIVVCAALSAVLWLEILALNTVIGEDIVLRVRAVDVAIGLTIYLKTSIDFAIFMGRLMRRYPGLKGRIAIEIGTAIGNAVGTFAILAIWAFFKEVAWLLASMIFVASLMLFRLAEESLEHAEEEDSEYPEWFRVLVSRLETLLQRMNSAADPLLKHIVPSLEVKEGGKAAFWSVFAMSFTIPFILGLDDFAGYVPLFDVVNVFGFGIGVFVGHMALNILLYLSPKRTIEAVKNPVISFIGSIAFVGLGIWGIVEVFRVLNH